MKSLVGLSQPAQGRLSIIGMLWTIGVGVGCSYAPSSTTEETPVPGTSGAPTKGLDHSREKSPVEVVSAEKAGKTRQVKIAVSGMT